MKFKYVAARICVEPIKKNEHLTISCDEDLWQSITNFKNIREVFFDQFNSDNNNFQDAIAYYQPRNKNSFDFFYENSFVSVISVDEKQYENLLEWSGIEPSLVYQKIDSELIVLGYEVVTGFSISAFCHGLSPYSEKSEYLLNKFGLFQSSEAGQFWVERNNKDILEHSPWFLIAHSVSESTYKRLISI